MESNIYKNKHTGREVVLTRTDNDMAYVVDFGIESPVPINKFLDTKNFEQVFMSENEIARKNFINDALKNKDTFRILDIIYRKDASKFQMSVDKFAKIANEDEGYEAKFARLTTCLVNDGAMRDALSMALNDLSVESLIVLEKEIQTAQSQQIAELSTPKIDDKATN